MFNDAPVLNLVTNLLYIKKEKGNEANEEDRKKRREGDNYGKRKGEQLWMELWGREIKMRENEEQILKDSKSQVYWNKSIIMNTKKKQSLRYRYPYMK